VIKDTDYKISIVPLAQRQSSFTMTLLLISMMVAFPTVLIGFDWYNRGFTFYQVIACIILGCLLLLGYQIPASYIGAKSGQTYALLSRAVFGRWGSRLVTINLICFAISWYALNPLFLADAINHLLHFNCSAIWITIVMAFNNFFGFKGIANFARYIAAPALIALVGYTFYFAVNNFHYEIPNQNTMENIFVPLPIIASIIIGYTAWGNEPDFFRYSKPNLFATFIPLAIAISIAWIIFGTTGWMLANIAFQSGLKPDLSAAYLLTFGSMPIVGVIVLALSYFAFADASLYGAINASRNLVNIPHKLLVSILAIIGSLVSAFLSISGCTKALELVSSLSSALLPIPMIIVLAECLLNKFVFKIPPTYLQVYNWDSLPSIRIPATIAFIIGSFIGIITSGVIPSLAFFHIDIYALFAWLTAIIIYVCLRLFEYKNEAIYKRIMLEKMLSNKEEQVLVGNEQD
jgi:purine-cytosine permease-like protein